MSRLALAVLLVSATTQAIAQDRTARPTRPPRGEDLPTWQATGMKGAVVAGGSEATSAGLEVLQAGGNAADAAVATLLALTVTDAHLACFGGEVPILIYDAATGSIDVIAGQGAAPALATREHFTSTGSGRIPLRGIEPAAVPGYLDACLTALDRRGTMTFARVAAPTLKLLDRGEYPWHADLAKTLRIVCDAEKSAGSDRRRGLRLAADAFYRGPIARRIDGWARQSGALIRYQDLARHVTRVEEPVTSIYRGHQIVKCGAWTQGPMLLQALQLLEGYDLKSLGHNSPEAIHLTTEAMKLAFADRDAYYADPLFVDVPLKELLDPEYARKRRELIDLKKASMEQIPGDPIRSLARHADPASVLPKGHAGPTSDTTTCLVADSKGNVVAATPSGWSGVLAGDTGVWLGSRLQSFNTQAGHPNVIEPFKRPRITLTPTLVLRDGKPLMAVSVAGGDNQDQVILQLLLNRIDFGLGASESVTAPRFLTDHFVGSFGQPEARLGSLKVYQELGEATIQALKDRGHKVEIGRPPMAAAPTVLAIDPSSGKLEAAGDPKAGRHAAAY
ncbi:MAG: gamma-glutamyltransferase [Isosphaeraceae bacterium]